MSTTKAREKTIEVLVYIVQVVGIGTNISLLRIMWAMMTGSFLKSRGSVHGALEDCGFENEEIRRGWSGLRYGSWEIGDMIEAWNAKVEIDGEWEANKIEGYRVKSIDITGFWRPKLKGPVNQLYNSIARRALPAVIFGVMTCSGKIGEKRVPLLHQIVRCKVGTSEKEFHVELLKATKKSMAADEVAVADAGFTVAEFMESGIERFIVRGAINCTARKNVLPEYKGCGAHPKYGELIRPLPRSFKGKELAETEAEKSGNFIYDKRTIRHESWHELVPSTTKVDESNTTFSIYVFHDPAYKKPLVLITTMKLTAESLYLFYKDRWPVEHPPLASKQMIGLHRQFVSHTESCFRLPELGLLTGNILSHLAASLPPIPTGFWDRTPKSTPGRLRRLLSKAIFPTLDQIDPEIRKKDSISDHLPKGVDAHRRSKATP